MNDQLLLAAESGDVVRLRECLAQGADVNARDDRVPTRHKTAMMLAATAGHNNIVQVLLKAGAEPNRTDYVDEDQSVLGMKSMLEHGDPEGMLEMGYRFGRTALMDAAIAGHVAVVQTLLEAGCDPNVADLIDYAPLALAVENYRLG